MDRRGPWPGGARALGLAALLAGTLAAPSSHAQPPSPPGRPDAAAPASDLAGARALYQSAEAAMKDGRFADAVRDYGEAYERSKDPALLFKLGRAHERAGACDVALTYYGRYLREGAPSETFTATTHARIRACGGDPDAVVARAEAGEPTPPAPKPDGRSGNAGAPAAPTGGGSAAARPRAALAPTGAAGPRPDAGAPAGIATPSTSHKVAWLLTGGAVALATLGGVLAYAAGSAENDVRDLYVGLAGQPPRFDAQTRKKYDDLIDQGHRYERLSWTSFGLAGAAAVGAAVLFSIGRRADATQELRVAPVVTPRSAGVAVSF